MHFYTSAALGLGIMLLGNLTTAADRPPVPGSYRPATDGQVRNTVDNHRQFIPSGNSNSRYSSPFPAQPAYAPPNYWNNNPPPSTTPAFSINPGNMMNNMFGGGNSNLPYGYPAMAAPARVAPVYDAPIPGSTPGWNYYGTPTTTPGYTTPAPAGTGTYGSTGNMTDPPATVTTPPPLEPTPSGQGRGQPGIKTQPAPRPYSNPQESGNAFVQRSNTGTRTSYGGNDSRFRPPELKGTP